MLQTIWKSTIWSNTDIIVSKGFIDTIVSSGGGGIGGDYLGTWNANTNTPSLVSGVGVENSYYTVAVAGDTEIDYNTGWNLNDWIVYFNGKWKRLRFGQGAPSSGGSGSGTPAPLPPPPPLPQTSFVIPAGQTANVDSVIASGFITQNWGLTIISNTALGTLFVTGIQIGGNLSYSVYGISGTYFNIDINLVYNLPNILLTVTNNELTDLTVNIKKTY